VILLMLCSWETGIIKEGDFPLDDVIPAPGRLHQPPQLTVNSYSKWVKNAEEWHPCRCWVVNYHC